jgi:hypothetical protein
MTNGLGSLGRDAHGSSSSVPVPIALSNGVQFQYKENAAAPSANRYEFIKAPFSETLSAIAAF